MVRNKVWETFWLERSWLMGLYNELELKVFHTHTYFLSETVEANLGPVSHHGKP